MAKSKVLRIPFLVDGIKKAMADFEALDRELNGLDKDVTKALTPIKQLPEEMQAAAREAEGALASLGIKSQRTARIQKAALLDQVKNLQKLRDQGLITAEDYEDAFRRAGEKLERINKSAGDSADRAAAQAQRAFRRLSLVSTESAEQQKKEIMAAYEAIRDSGTATPEDIARAWDRAEEEIEAVNKQIVRTIETEADRAAREAGEAAKKLGLTTAYAADEQKREIIEAYEAIRDSGTATPEDIARAWEIAEGRIDAINKSITRQVETESEKASREAQEAAKELGLTTAASAEEQRRVIEENYRKIAESGTATPEDIARAWKIAEEKIEKVNASIADTAESEADRTAREVGEAAKRLGLTTTAAAEDQKREILADYERIRDSGTATPYDIARAWDIAQSRIERITADTTENIEDRWRLLAAEIRVIAGRITRHALTASAAITRMSSRASVSSLGLMTRGLGRIGTTALGTAAMVTRAARLMTTGIGTILKAGGTLFGGTVFGGGAAASLFAKSVADTAGEFERIATALKQTTGEDFERASKFVKEYAETIVFSESQVSQALLSLRNFGFDQSSAEFTLGALVEQISKMGGSYEDLEGIILATGQAWSKQKLQGEEILQLIERGVPVWELLQKVTGENVQELQKLSEAGDLGRETISALIGEIGRSASGSSAAQLDTYNGLVTQLGASWSNLKREVAGSGVMENVKSVIRDLIEYLGDPDTVRRATRFAEIGVLAFEMLVNGGKGLIEFFADRGLDTLERWITRANDQFWALVLGGDRLFDQVVGFVDGAVTSIENGVALLDRVVGPAIRAVTTITDAVGRGFAALDNETTGAFADNIAGAVEGATRALGTLLSNVDSGSVAELVGNLGSLVRTLGELGEQAAGGAGAQSAMTNLSSILEKVSGFLETIERDFIEIFEKGFGAASLESPLLRQLQEFVREDLPEITSAIEKITGLLNNPGEALASGAKGGILALGDGVESMSKGAVMTVWQNTIGALCAGAEKMALAPAPAGAPISPSYAGGPATERHEIILKVGENGRAVRVGQANLGAIRELQRDVDKLNSTQS